MKLVNHYPRLLSYPEKKGDKTSLRYYNASDYLIGLLSLAGALLLHNSITSTYSIHIILSILLFLGLGVVIAVVLLYLRSVIRESLTESPAAKDDSSGTDEP